MLLNYQQKQSSEEKADQKKETIFIIHGLFGSLSNLAGLAGSLQKKHHTVCVDLRNHGNSPQNSGNSYQDMVNDIFELANHLAIDKFSIVGHSMGGKVAMLCALQQPNRINKIAVADIAPVCYEDKHSDVFKGLQAVAKAKLSNRKEADLILGKYIETAEVRQFLLKSLQKKENSYQFQFNLQALYNNYQAIRNWPACNQTFNKETLFIKGANSDYISGAKQATILSLFPTARAKVIENTGHWLHAEKSKIFNRLLVQFFN